MEKKIKEMIKATLNVNIDNMTEEEKDYPLLSKSCLLYTSPSPRD